MSKNKKRKSYESCNDFYSEFRSNSTNSILGIDFSNNQEQRELIRLMNCNDNPIIFCTGDAGTGKTFTAIAAAIDLVKIKKKYSKIFYIREPLEVGKSLGFLPGTLDEKYSVYTDGLHDNLEHISQLSGLNTNDMMKSIECTPPQYIRGRSFLGDLLIVDEAQNLSLETIQAICTRLGKFCKLVFLGSSKQIDIKGVTWENCGFKVARDILSNLEDSSIVGAIELIKSERSEYCKILDEAFNNYKSSHTK